MAKKAFAAAFFVLILILALQFSFYHTGQSSEGPLFFFDKELRARDHSMSWLETESWKKIIEQQSVLDLERKFARGYLFEISSDYNCEDLNNLSNHISSCGLQEWKLRSGKNLAVFATLDSKYYQFDDGENLSGFLGVGSSQRSTELFLSGKRVATRKFVVTTENFEREFKEIKQCGADVIFGLEIQKSLSADKYFELSNYIYKVSGRPPILFLREGSSVQVE